MSFERVEKLIKNGYIVTYTAVIPDIAIVYTFIKEFKGVNRDPFGNATGGGYLGIDTVEVTYYKDGTIEITR